MYRVVLYSLILMWLGALILSFFGLQQFTASDLFLSTAFILAVCYFTNYIFARVFGAPTNYDSVYITAIILSFIISPNNPFENLWFLGWAGVIAMASKYILAINKKHIFNPAAFAVVITSLCIGQSASWWVANLYMTPIVFFFGYLIVRKIQRFDLVYSFVLVSLCSVAVLAFMRGDNIFLSAGKALIYSPIIFFSTVMLTEPFTTPPNKKLRIVYGLITGFLFAPFIHIGSFYGTPELSLIAGNIFSYFVSPKYKLILKLKGRKKIAENTYSLSFKTDQSFNFKPGQYFEWTVPHHNPDSSGIRRYFTIASSPTEDHLEIGVRFPSKPSSFKRRLLSMGLNDEVVVSQLSGDFVLPKNKNKRLVFIAGGIGITPFRSMIKYLVDSRENRSATLFYVNKRFEDIAYYNFLNNASTQIDLRVIYALTDIEFIPENWTGIKGRVDGETIIKKVQDYENCLYYLSGPTVVVAAYRDILLGLGVNRRQIKTDYFPGFV